MSAVKSAPAYVVYKMGRLLDQSVSTLDPLGFDTYFATNAFSRIANAEGKELIRAFNAEVIVSIGVPSIRLLDEVSAMAAARDLNMVASAAARHKIPMHELPHLEELLLLLSEKTREVPTDTVFGYGTRNPSGIRQRSFTKTEEERSFITSFSSGMYGLTVALAGLETVQSMELTNPRYASLVRESSFYLGRMQEAISGVRKQISPDFFTHRLRPFFDPKTIRGNTYFAAGGAQMPITLVDLMVWGIEESDRTYVGYRNENVRYLPWAYQSKIEGMMSLPSIIRASTDQIGKGMMAAEARQTAIDSLQSLQMLVDQLIRFRAPHLGIAKANMRIRNAGSVGSGGYDVAILQYLLRKTKTCKAELARLEQFVQDSST